MVLPRPPTASTPQVSLLRESEVDGTEVTGAPSLAEPAGQDDTPAAHTTLELHHLPCHPVASFATPKIAQASLNVFARGLGYALVVKHTYYDKRGAPRRIVYGCDRHSDRRANSSRPGASIRPNASTRRCDCPMQVDLVRRRNIVDGRDVVEWDIEHRGKETAHNHSPSSHPSSHPIHRRADRTAAVRQEIITDSQTGTRAAQTLARILIDDPDSIMRARDIYNERHRAEIDRRQGRSRIEYLHSLLAEPDYRVESRVDGDQRLTHLFFALNQALDIFAANPDVILMDCTYKTNVFQLPLLNMVGVSGMNTTIHLAQAFLRGEAQPDYTWALRLLRDVLQERGIPLPQVFFVDRDLALVNALETEFPSVPVLLCQWHIIRDVESHARQHGLRQEIDAERSTQRSQKWKDSDQHREFCDAFVALTRAKTESDYEEMRTRLHELHAGEAAYVDDVWLDVWKRRIVRYWTNDVLHFDLHTTSRVEGYHAALKRWLCSSTGDLLNVFTRMQHWWRQSVNKHLGGVSDAQIKTPRSLRGRLFERVVRVIHVYALKKCLDQLDAIGNSACSGVYSRTTGLPCYHRLRQLQISRGSLTPTDFNAHWWIDRTAAPQVAPARILEPETIAERRAQRRRATQSNRRGAGPRGTRRDPSRHELVGDEPVRAIVVAGAQALPSLAVSIARSATPATRLARIRYHPMR